jgi:hypothetical protein
MFKHVQHALDQDGTTELKTYLARCLVQILQIDLSRCSVVWIRMMQLTLEPTALIDLRNCSAVWLRMMQLIFESVWRGL